MQWNISAPSNIALIKYMGKKNAATNTPANASLSYTLPHLVTTIELTTINGNRDQFAALPNAPYMLNLSHAGEARFLQHLQRLKQHFEYDGAFLVRSANNFPQGTGLASSASSFAALTQCAVIALCELQDIAPPSITEQAKLSRIGSGSSCRSFFEPWVLWEEEEVLPIQFTHYQKLHHRVIVVDAVEKTVSSSEAHRRILHSPHYALRVARANENLSLLQDALNNSQWQDAYLICWREFQDMHHLFETASPAFSYRKQATLQLLTQLAAFWDIHGDGPLVTMDAGPNIHLLYRPDQIDLALKFEHDYVDLQHTVYTSGDL